ncbi:tRNA dihydrouridine synthase [Paludibacterium paludis]|uniref:tRNA-dihydrouridine(16) synthase n=1 Tax=Paludibacterium paludis TaxID=1225769 RepID=A0A918U9G6_9NEIS|nr:tRNA-dihydrouridine synthase family protein [Paludibacterium paludis]GGY13243.1 tRNA-dihydrouridine(16) synthase [Paludibacterium paludis]
MKLVLAPMEGLVDDIMRDILTRVGGIDLCVTEFVRVTSHLHSPRTFHRLAPELRHGARTRAGTPLRVQLLGSDPMCLAENAELAARLGARGVDLNFGCPAPTVNRHRGGAILLTEPPLLHEIVSAVRRAVPADVPVTAKMRLGYEDKTQALDCARAIAEAGANELTVHGRTKVEGYRPPAHWDWIARIREAVTIPVVANGEVWTLDDYRAIRRESGCETVMIGRGLVACPDLAMRIKRARTGLDEEPMDWHEMMPWVRDFYGQCMARGGVSRYPASRLKQWLGQLKRTWPEAGEWFERVRREEDPLRIEALLSER